MPTALRLPWKVGMDEPTWATVIRAPVDFAGDSPAIKLRRSHCLDARHRSSERPFSCLLRPDDLYSAVLKRLRPKRNSLPYEVVPNPAIVGRVPELPVRPDERLPAIKSVWNPAMSLYPIVPEVSERRKIHDPLLIHSLFAEPTHRGNWGERVRLRLLAV